MGKDWDQELRVLNDGTTAKYFLLGRGARQGDPISAFYTYFSFRDLILSYKVKIID